MNILYNTITGILGVRLEDLNILRKPGPMTKYFELLFLSFYKLQKKYTFANCKLYCYKNCLLIYTENRLGTTNCFCNQLTNFF